MTTLYSLGYRSNALPVHSSYTKGQVMLLNEQWARSQHDQRRRRSENSRTKVLLRAVGYGEGRYTPRNGRARESQRQKEDRVGPRSASTRAHLVRKAAGRTGGQARPRG